MIVFLEKNCHIPMLFASTLNQHIRLNHMKLPTLNYSCPTKNVNYTWLSTFLNSDTLVFSASELIKVLLKTEQNEKRKKNKPWIFVVFKIQLKYNTYIINYINMGHLSLGINTGIYNSHEEKWEQYVWTISYIHQIIKGFYFYKKMWYFYSELNLNNKTFLFFLTISQLTCIIRWWSEGTNNKISDKKYDI